MENKQPLGSLVVPDLNLTQTASKSMISGDKRTFWEIILTWLNQSHLHVIALINLLADPCWRRKSHILEWDLTLWLPTGTKENMHIQKIIVISVKQWHSTLIYVVCWCAFTHLFSNATVTDPSWTSFTKACREHRGEIAQVIASSVSQW